MNARPPLSDPTTITLQTGIREEGRVYALKAGRTALGHAEGALPAAVEGVASADRGAPGSDSPARVAPGDNDTALRIERCEGWLASHPNDAMLLLSLGRLCIRAGLLARAQGYLEASLSIEPTHSAHLALARLHQALNHQEAAASHRDQALSLALRALDTATGGRRRASL